MLCFLKTGPTGACRSGFLAVFEKMFNVYIFTSVSIIVHVLQNVQQDGCAREVVSGAILANTGVVVVPNRPTSMWWWCHIGQHGCGGGATLASTGGGATLSNTGVVVVVPH